MLKRDGKKKAHISTPVGRFALEYLNSMFTNKLRI